jgi:DNA-nicking Smr family endonuclease
LASRILKAVLSSRSRAARPGRTILQAPPPRRADGRKRIKDEERELFRAAMRGVKPLGQAKPLPVRERRRPRAASRRADEALALADSLRLDPADLDVESGEELRYRRDGVAETVLRRLKQGEFAVRDEIDLHGMTQDEARLALGAFLSEAVAQRRRCVRVIHGKGRGSGQRGPVLK